MTYRSADLVTRLDGTVMMKDGDANDDLPGWLSMTSIFYGASLH